MMFVEYSGDMMGLAVTENHRVYRLNQEDFKIIFSVARQGNAASCHFASDKKGLRHVKESIVSFCKFCFFVFPWCEMILANVDKTSVERIVEKLGFSLVASNESQKIYARLPWDS